VSRFLLLILAVLAVATPAAAQKRIALTFDDVPRSPGAFMNVEQRTERLIAALRRARVAQAGFFVNPGNLALPWGPGGEARLDAYVRAGHVIANHSWSHPSLSQIGAEAYIANIDRATEWLRPRRGYRPWFRYPYLDEGIRQGAAPGTRDAVRAALAERHILNAYVTVDSMDWLVDQLINQAHQAGQAIDMAALRALYIEIIVTSAEFADRLARDALGRRPAHVMLLHETDVGALFIADAVAALRARGWRIVTADAAFADPIARREPESPALGAGRVAALASEPGMPQRQLSPELNRESTVRRLFSERVLHAPPAAPAPAP
jgi:peptidoglycan/xylan/chitin deacetylase (PgdA/CDA1 family)